VEELARLRETAGEFLPQVAQGAAFAAKTRQRAGNPAPHTEMACRFLCCLEPEAAAAVTDDTLVALPADGELPAYAVWRQRISEHFAPPARAARAAGGTV
jgi:hypothetical protein